MFDTSANFYMRHRASGLAIQMMGFATEIRLEGAR